MIKILLVFVILAVLFGFGISFVRNLTGKEAWDLTKSISYAIMCSILALLVLIGLVILF